jgi:hypothetical protein
LKIPHVERSLRAARVVVDSVRIAAFAGGLLAGVLATTAATADAGRRQQTSAQGIVDVIDLNQLTLRDGFTIESHLNSGPYQLGLTASSAGDFNGDSLDDVVLGTEKFNFAAIVYGRKRKHLTPVISTRKLLGGTSRGVQITSPPDGKDRLAAQVSGGGDVNKDRYDDLIVGAPGRRIAWIVYGGRGRPAIDLDPGKPPKQYASRINGPPLDDGVDDGFGSSVAMLGDVNGDRVADVAIGAPDAKKDCCVRSGVAYVVFGRRDGGLPRVSSIRKLDGFRLVGRARGDRVGALVAAAGDVNGDGIADILVGDPSNDPGGRVDAGTLYVVFGRKGGFPAEVDLRGLDGTTGFAIDGVLAGDRLGQRPGRGPTAAAAGDVNGDGIGDIVLTADGGNDTDASRAGFVVFGSRKPLPKVFDLTSLNGRNGFRTKTSGRAVAGVGDANGDGFGDLMLGGGADPLHGYVLLGQSPPFPGLVELGKTKGVRMVKVRGLTGPGPVAPAGDVDKDGRDDILLGAPFIDANKPDTPEGGGYVLFGQKWR